MTCPHLQLELKLSRSILSEIRSLSHPVKFKGPFKNIIIVMHVLSLIKKTSNVSNEVRTSKDVGHQNTSCLAYDQWTLSILRVIRMPSFLIPIHPKACFIFVQSLELMLQFSKRVRHAYIDPLFSQTTFPFFLSPSFRTSRPFVIYRVLDMTVSFACVLHLECCSHVWLTR